MGCHNCLEGQTLTSTAPACRCAICKKLIWLLKLSGVGSMPSKLLARCASGTQIHKSQAKFAADLPMFWRKKEKKDQNTQKVTKNIFKSDDTKQHVNFRDKLFLQQTDTRTLNFFSSKQTHKHYSYDDNEADAKANNNNNNLSCLVKETAQWWQLGKGVGHFFTFSSSLSLL